MKKIIVLCMTLVLTITAFGCGNKGESGSAEAADAVKVVEIDLTNEEYAFGVDKDQPELLEQVNQFIAKIQEDGTLDEIFNKYFGDGEPTPITSATLDTSKDQLVVATNASFEPFEYMDGDSYVGVDMEIAALLAEELGQELVIQNMEFDAVFLLGSINAILQWQD